MRDATSPSSVSRDVASKESPSVRQSPTRAVTFPWRARLTLHAFHLPSRSKPQCANSTSPKGRGQVASAGIREPDELHLPQGSWSSSSGAPRPAQNICECVTIRVEHLSGADDGSVSPAGRVSAIGMKSVVLKSAAWVNRDPLAAHTQQFCLGGGGKIKGGSPP